MQTIEENCNGESIGTLTEEHEIQEIFVSSLNIDDSLFFSLPNDERPHIKVAINGSHETALVDTGSMACVIGYSDRKQLEKFRAEIKPTNVVITTLHAQRKPASGKMDLTYVLGEATHTLRTILVPAKRFQIIVGTPFCKAFGIGLARRLGIDVGEILTAESPTIISTVVDALKQAFNSVKKRSALTSRVTTSLNEAKSIPTASAHDIGTGSPSQLNSETVHTSRWGSLTKATHAIAITPPSAVEKTEVIEPLAADTSRRAVSGTVKRAIEQWILAEELDADSEEQEIMAITDECQRLHATEQEECVYSAEFEEEFARTHQPVGRLISEITTLNHTGCRDMASIEPESSIIETGNTQLDPIEELAAMILEVTEQEANASVADGGITSSQSVRTAEGTEDTILDVLPEKKACVSMPHDLSTAQRAILDDVISQFPYTAKTGPLNVTPSFVQRINLHDERPTMRKQYPLSPYQLAEIEKELKVLLDRDIIEPIQTSPWRWPILWVKKKNGGGRICLDARGLNERTIPEAYPTLNVDEILRNLPQARYFSCLDMTQAFHQIEIAPQDRPKCAFSVGNRFFQYKRAVMGFRNSPADLAKMLDNIFHDLQPRVFRYVDDFIIISQTFEEHMKLLKIIAQRLRQYNLTISREKSTFCHAQLTFLGYVLSQKGLSVNPEKIAAITAYKQPETVKGVRRLTGLIGWYRRFMPRAAEILKPLTDLIKVGSKWIKWTPEAAEAFERTKEILTSEPVLSPADFTLPFRIYTDACDVAGSGILTQVQNGEEKVIAYHSVKFNPAQQNYSATERECLAVLSAIEKFRPWIDGVRFTVVTDHASLKWLQNLKNPNGKLARWAVRLQAFDIEFLHRPGRLMAAPDALSRAVALIEVKADMETTDAWYKRIRKLAKSHQLERYKFEDGHLYHKGRYDTRVGDRLWTLCIPQELVPIVLQEKHDHSTHMGYWKTLKSIQASYYWPNMHREIYAHVTKCQLCRTIKPSNEQTKTTFGTYRDPERVGRMLSMDMIGPLPAAKFSRHMHAVVVIDCFSRYTFTRSFTQATAAKLIQFLEEEVFYRFDTPEVIITDNGPQFKSKVFRTFLEKYRIRHHTTPYYHAQANQVEATNKSIKTGLRALIATDQAEHTAWAAYLPRITMTLNTTPHTSTGFSPHRIVFGQEKHQTGDEHRLLSDPNVHDNENEEGSNSAQSNDRAEPLPESAELPVEPGQANGAMAEEQRRQEIMREEASNKARESHEINKRRHGLRARTRKFQLGDQVYVAHKQLSSASDRFASKLAPVRRVAFIEKVLGQDTYELRGIDGQSLGKYHAQLITLQ